MPFDKDKKTYYLTLPMPPSVNAAYQPVYRKGGFAGKGHSDTIKTQEYKEWEVVDASASFRRQFPGGTPKVLEGRLQVQYTYHFTSAHGGDIFNREKVLSDFLEKKFFKNDSQIDVGVVRRRVRRDIVKSYVEIWITEIEDHRFDDMFGKGGY